MAKQSFADVLIEGVKFRETEYSFPGAEYSFDEARAVLFGVPFDETASFKQGSSKGPQGIRYAAVEGLETFSTRAGIDYFDNIKIADIGDIVLEGKKVEEVLELVERVVSYIKTHGKIPIMLGGEHTLTLGAMGAFEKEKPLLIHFDSDADLRDEHEGRKVDHSTPIRRVLDFLPKENLMQLGVKAMDREQFEFIKDNNIRTVFAHDLKRDLNGTKKALSKFTKGRQFYLSIDVDVLDAGLVPGTGTPEPGGLTFDELIELIESLNGKLVGMDLVETGPDENHITEITAGKVLVEAFCQGFFDR